jgi:hypothetical protein
MSLRRVTVALLALASFPSTPAVAQLTPKQAIAVLKTGTSNALKTLKASLKLDVTVFSIAIADLKDKADAGTFTLADFDAFCTDVDTFQRNVAGDAHAASKQVADAAGEAWASVPPELLTAMPEGFYLGDGGVLDKFRSDARKALDKTYASLRTKLRKVGDSLTKKADTRLVFRLDPPSDIDAWIGVGPSAAIENAFVPLTVDTVLVVTTGEALPAHVCMGGAADSDNGVITFGLDIGGGACPTFTMVGASEGRWSGPLTMNFGSGCASNYFCSVEQGGNESWTFPIGLPGTVP